MTDNEGRSRLYGYVNLYNKKDAYKAKEKYDGWNLKGCQIRVYYSVSFDSKMTCINSYYFEFKYTNLKFI